MKSCVVHINLIKNHLKQLKY